jgi:hypothetical protein
VFLADVRISSHRDDDEIEAGSRTQGRGRRRSTVRCPAARDRAVVGRSCGGADVDWAAGGCMWEGADTS